MSKNQRSKLESLMNELEDMGFNADLIAIKPFPNKKCGYLFIDQLC